MIVGRRVGYEVHLAPGVSISHGTAERRNICQEAWRNVKVTDVKPGFHVEAGLKIRQALHADRPGHLVKSSSCTQLKLMVLVEAVEDAGAYNTWPSATISVFVRKTCRKTGVDKVKC